jgi:hypothetical protein
MISGAIVGSLTGEYPAGAGLVVLFTSSSPYGHPECSDRQEPLPTMIAVVEGFAGTESSGDA